MIYYVVFALRRWDEALRTPGGEVVRVDDLDGMIGFMPVFGSYEDAYHEYPEREIRQVQTPDNAELEMNMEGV